MRVKGERERFATGLGAFAATLGSAVGLGNIWKFPYLAGTFGGAAFILVYLLSVAVAGLPLLLAEFLIGRRTRANAVDAFARLAPGTPWYLVGVAGTVASCLVLAFYTTVAGWVYAYTFRALSGALSSASPKAAQEAFASLAAHPTEPLLWQLAAVAVTGGIVGLGVRRGIEGATKRLMPLLFLILLACDVRALLLPRAAQGLAFLLRPDFAKVGAEGVLTAVGLAFFKLSLGMGNMITYGSYQREEQNLPATVAQIVVADTAVSLLAGLAIFPAAFSFGFKPDAGPSLLFITIPAVFSAMPLGRLFLTLFFVLTAIAATCAMIALFEVPVAFLVERLRWRRPLAVALTGAGLALVGSTATLSYSALRAVRLLGRGFFDLYDFAASNVLLPVGGILVALFVGWRWSWEDLCREGSNGGRLNNRGLLRGLRFLLRYVAPAAILVVLLSGLGLLRT